MARKTYEQHVVDVKLISVVTKAITNRNAQVPRCPLCSWEGNAHRWDSRDDILSKVKRHMREKHRVYYNLANSKPFVIEEEEEEYAHG